MAAQAQPTVQIDNERTRVTEWRFAPGAATGFHTHEFDYVVVPLTSGQLRAVDGNGAETTAELISGLSYFRQAGVAHNVVNDSPHEFVFVEIEYK